MEGGKISAAWYNYVRREGDELGADVGGEAGGG